MSNYYEMSLLRKRVADLEATLSAERTAWQRSTVELMGQRTKAERALTAATRAAKMEGQREVLEKIESIIGEFGDDPNECAPILGEYVGLALHHIRLATRECNTPDESENEGSER